MPSTAFGVTPRFARSVNVLWCAHISPNGFAPTAQGATPAEPQLLSRRSVGLDRRVQPVHALQRQNGGYNDQRTISPQMIEFLQLLDSGAGASIAEVASSSSSAYNPDIKDNGGKAYPTTPGHFDQPAACDPT